MHLHTNHKLFTIVHSVCIAVHNCNLHGTKMAWRRAVLSSVRYACMVFIYYMAVSPPLASSNYTPSDSAIAMYSCRMYSKIRANHQRTHQLQQHFLNRANTSAQFYWMRFRWSLIIISHMSYLFIWIQNHNDKNVHQFVQNMATKRQRFSCQSDLMHK